MSSSTAGRGDPYWYEWFVGLVEIVEMLDTGSATASVAFQVEGVKGWDDVIVVFMDGRRRCYQVKHTREQNSLTFGDLISANPDGESLLGSLFEAWRAAKLNDGRTECILYTNREAGLRGYTPEGGAYRPPLLKFERWMRDGVTQVGALSELTPPAEWEAAWHEWLAILAGNNATDDERLAFLRALRIRADEDDLDGLDARVRDGLAIAFGVPAERVSPLVDALHRALKRWTTGHPPVTAEHVYSELALRAEKKDLAPAPPPPEPFFPSREPLVGDLEKLLLAENTPPVVFLSAEPGAGKTSVLSRLANRRVDVPLSGLIGLRYFCFEPIRPDAPIIAPDAGRVRPENLWLSLLAQLREGLRGRLRELRVPVRNDLLTWQDAREHVLRLAAILGTEWKRPFVIVIDGIDHAARAAQDGKQEAAEFFASLPNPDTLANLLIRLFIAGQPPEQYPRYPKWLHGDHPHVLKLSLGHVSTDDVRALYSAEPSGLPPEHADEAVRLIQQTARGNTLATVFAVAEAANVVTLPEFAERLEQRRLRDGLESYYSAIWDYALGVVGVEAASVDTSLVGALCLARGGITPELLANAFAAWQLPTPRWRQLFQALGPLLVEAEDGFRVRHNDVRLFLAARFAGRDPAQRQKVASQLADYYLAHGASGGAAHRAVFPLLDLAGRSAEAARIFNVEWVCGAAAAGIESEQLLEECAIAVRELPALREWDATLNVACAVQTLERLHEQSEEARTGDANDAVREVPPFLPSEASVRPRSTWTVDEFSALVGDADRLLSAGMHARATGLLNRWLHGMSVCDLVKSITGMVVREEWGDQEERLRNGMDERFAKLGRLSRDLTWTPPRCEPQTRPERSATIAFERGYVEAACAHEEAQTLDECFGSHVPRFFVSWQHAVEKLARRGRWTLVKTALHKLTKHISDLSATFVGESAWWALISGAAADHPDWVRVLKEPFYGLASGSNTPITAFLAIARVRGWEEVANEPGDIADGVYAAFDRDRRHEDTAPLTRLLFRGAAFVGRVRAVASRSGWAAARGIVNAAQATALLEALWSREVVYSPRFSHGPTAAAVAAELAEVCLLLGGEFARAALDAALPHALKYPVDFRRPGLWRVVTFHGERELLISWLKHWLGASGEAWKCAPSERGEIVQELVPLARELGERPLADDARERLRWSQIGYRSEERSFAEAVRWMRELCRREPAAWRDEGWKLWSLAEACEAQFCSVNASAELEEGVMAAAMRRGPSDLWQLLAATLPKSAERKWHYETRNRLGSGFAQALRDGAALSMRERLTLWCLVTTFCRWFDGGDIVTLAELRDELLTTCADDAERASLLSELARLTPGESQRRPDEERARPPETVSVEESPRDYSIDAAIAVVEGGGTLPISELAKAVRHLSRTNDPRRDELIPWLLSAAGSGDEYGMAWSWGDSFVDAAVASIASQVTDDQLWALIAAISQPRSDLRTWLAATAENLHRLALARARTRGVEDMRRGLKTHIAMHSAWAFGGLRWQPVWPALPPADDVKTWDEIVVRMLGVLFTARSGEVLSSAVTGMHALVSLSPENVVPLFQTLRDEWAHRWVLNAAEAWAALHPAGLEAVRPSLEETMRTAHFEARLQAWIILCKLADAQKRERPSFPMPRIATRKRNDLQHGGGGILETTPLIRGLMRHIDRHAGATGKLDRLRSCGFDFSPLDRDISQRLLDYPSEANAIAILNSAPHRDDDFLCSGLETEHAVGEALDSVISAEWCSDKKLARLAQGLFDNEDAWILRHTPLPSPAPEEWPTKELGALTKEVSGRDLVDRLRHLAVHQALPEGWTVAAASVYAATWQEDFAFFTWLEEMPDEPHLIERARKPTIPSGRTFNWWLGDHFEPEPPNGRAVMAFFTGGAQRLLHASLEIQPAKLWRAFAWEPDPDNPLQWLRETDCVARYQSYHGGFTGSGRGPHYRQPLLHRWIVHTKAFAEASDAAHLVFRTREDFERRKGDFEG